MQDPLSPPDITLIVKLCLALLFLFVIVLFAFYSVSAVYVKSSVFLDPYGAYGLKVIGGKMTDDGKLGAFITEIRKGGPAERQAQLQIGTDFSSSAICKFEQHFNMYLDCTCYLWRQVDSQTDSQTAS